MTSDLSPWSPLQPQSYPKSVFLMFALDLGVVGKGVRWQLSVRLVPAETVAAGIFPFAVF